MSVLCPPLPLPAASLSYHCLLALHTARLSPPRNEVRMCRVGHPSMHQPQSRGRSHGLWLQAVHEGATGSRTDKAEHEGEEEGFTPSNPHSAWMQEMVQLMESSQDYYPIIRTYRNDLCMLQLCGSAKGSQALAAMASDTSCTAATDLLMRRPLTILETVLPGSTAGHSTISTKLFAPSRLVLESTKTLTMPSGGASKDVRCKLFEAVQVLHLSKFYIEFYAVGTKRNMDALAAEGKASIFHQSCLDYHHETSQAINILEFSAKEVLDELARAVTLYAIACIKENNIHDVLKWPSWSYISKMWQRHQWFPSSHAAIRIRTLSAPELLTESKKLLGSSRLQDTVVAHEAVVRECWWPAPTVFKNFLRNSLGKSFEQWAYDYLPVHRLEINMNLLGAKEDTGQNNLQEVHELLLSHAQLMDLSGLLDLYYNDIFTLPNKKINTGIRLYLNKFSRSKIDEIRKVVYLVIWVLGIVIFAALVTVHLRQKRVPAFEAEVGKLKANSFTLVDPSIGKCNRIDPVLPINHFVSPSAMECLCRLVVAKVKENFNWCGEIHSNAEKGAWMESNFLFSGNKYIERDIMEEITRDKTLQGSGTQMNPHWKCNHEVEVGGEPALSLVGENDGNPVSFHQASGDIQLGKPSRKIQEADAISKDSLLYQVVLSLCGDVMGFQPLNQAAVMKWAQMPFAKELHRGHKLCAGFFEKKVEYRGPPTDAVVIELLIQMDSASPFISARPVHF